MRPARSQTTDGACLRQAVRFAVSGLRYFTVYGPWGRPDMAPMLFAKSISAGEPIKVFNNGQLSRDFTYIDDIVEGTVRVIDHLPVPADTPDGVAYRIYNIGCGHPVQLMDFIGEMEQALGREARKVYLPHAAGRRVSDLCGYVASGTGSGI